MLNFYPDTLSTCLEGFREFLPPLWSPQSFSHYVQHNLSPPPHRLSVRMSTQLVQHSPRFLSVFDCLWIIHPLKFILGVSSYSVRAGHFFLDATTESCVTDSIILSQIYCNWWFMYSPSLLDLGCEVLEDWDCVYSPSGVYFYIPTAYQGWAHLVLDKCLVSEWEDKCPGE